MHGQTLSLYRYISGVCSFNKRGQTMGKGREGNRIIIEEPQR